MRQFTAPSFATESSYWQQGIAVIAGLDEVGMGAWAGPVVAATVVFAAPCEIPGLRDSKLLTAAQREAVIEHIEKKAQAWAVGEASVVEIDRFNIRAASHLAMRRAIEKLNILPQLLLIDGRPAQPHRTIPAVSLVRGDSLSCSIAAASVLAKVHRDQLMRTLGEEYPQYAFAAHKGYGSAQHQEALARHGVCPVHRRSYAPIAKMLTEMRQPSTLQP